MADTAEASEWIKQDLKSKGVPESDASELAQCEAYGGRWGEAALNPQEMRRWKELRAKYAHVLGEEENDELI